MFVVLASVLALGAAPQDGDAWLARLRTESLSAVPPQAIILRIRDHGPSRAISFYRTRASGPSRAWTISARLETWNGAETQVLWTSAASCRALAEVVATIERAPLPRPELTPTEPGPWPSPPPRMGPLHVSHRLWMSAWDSDGAPIHITLSSLGSGTPGALFDNVDDRLADCWTEPLPAS